MESVAVYKAFAISVMPLLALSLSPSTQAQNPADLPAQIGPTLQANPFTRHEKVDYRMLQVVGLHGYMGAALGAAVGQATNTPHEWGEGAKGYGTRYISDFGTNVIRQSVALGLEEGLHEDPRYFPSEDKDFKHRIKNVVLQTFVARTDSGGNTFAWARIGSAFAAGSITNAWQPPSTRTAGHTFARSFISLGGDLGYNFLQEFFPFTRPRAFRH